MGKRLIALLLVLLFVAGGASTAYAHDDQAKHDRDLKYALFGSDKALSGVEKTRFQTIADAAALAIDQFSPNDSLRWKEGKYHDLQEHLRSLGLPTLSTDFDAINLNSSVTVNSENVTANSHRKYTHLGWNYKSYPNIEFWKTRKQVLLHAVNWTLFNDKAVLSWMPWVSDALYSPSEQCEAFSAMVYYIHILGDHIEGDVPNKLTDLEPLIQYDNLSSPGIIVELKEQLQIVFISQVNSWTYAALMESLSNLGVRAEQNCGMWGTVDSVEKCAINQKYAKELLDILSGYLPMLLKNEPFFDEHF